MVGSETCITLADEIYRVLSSSDLSRYALMASVTKTMLTDCQDQFDDYRESTIGAAFLTQTISLDDTTTVKFEIWDTAGQERYKSLAPMYYRNANCAVVVYDITQAVSVVTDCTGQTLTQSSRLWTKRRPG